MDDVVEVAVRLTGNVVAAGVPLAGGIGDDFLHVAQVGEKLARSILVRFFFAPGSTLARSSVSVNLLKSAATAASIVLTSESRISRFKQALTPMKRSSPNQVLKMPAF